MVVTQSLSDRYNPAGPPDNNRDGISLSWSTEDSHFTPPSVSQPPWKQIIGFAKFHTRQEALEARDILQGKRVDAGSTGGIVDSLTSLTSIQPFEPLATHERELGAIGAMGLGSRRNRLGDYTDSEDMGRMLRGANGRSDEDEREELKQHQESDALQIRSLHTMHFIQSQFTSPQSLPLKVSSIGGGPAASSHDPTGSLGSNVWGMTGKEVNRRLPIRVTLLDLPTRLTSPQASPKKSTGLPSSTHGVESDGSSGIHPSDTLSPLLARLSSLINPLSVSGPGLIRRHPWTRASPFPPHPLRCPHPRRLATMGMEPWRTSSPGTWDRCPSDPRTRPHQPLWG